ELTPLQAIRRLAAAVGAVVQPAMAADTLIVRPRYAVLPWDLWAADMNRTIHENQILSEGGTLETRPLINAVYVTGEREGVALSATRLGTAGDQPGPDVVDAWLTEQPANAARAAQEIAASGDRIIHTLELAIPETSAQDRKSTRLNSSHVKISYAVFCLKKKNKLTSNPADAEHE